MTPLRTTASTRTSNARGKGGIAARTIMITTSVKKIAETTASRTLMGHGDRAGFAAGA